MSSYQANISYNSIIDGQPAPAGQPLFSITAAKVGAEYQYEGSIGYTPGRKGFFRNSLFSVLVPSINTGDGVTDFERSLSIVWLQRWQYEKNGRPTISTMFSCQNPYDEPGEKTDLVGTLIITKNIGHRGVGYFNCYAETRKGITADSVGYGTVAGYKLFLPGQKELFLDVLYQAGRVLTFEASFEFDFPKGISLCPGINYAWNTLSGSFIFGAGLVLYYQSPKPIGRKTG